MTFADAAGKLHIEAEDVIQLLIETDFFKQNRTPYVKYINEGYFTKTHFHITKKKEEEVISILKQKLEKKRNTEIAKRKKALASYLSIEPSSIYWDGEIPFENSLFYHGYDAIYEVLLLSEVKEKCLWDHEDDDCFIEEFASRLTIEQIIAFLDNKTKLASFVEGFIADYNENVTDEIYETSTHKSFVREMEKSARLTPRKAWNIISKRLKKIDNKRFNDECFYKCLIEYLEEEFSIQNEFAEYAISIIGVQDGIDAFSYFHKYKKVGRKPNIYFIRQLKEEETRGCIPHMEKKCRGCTWYVKIRDDERDCCMHDNKEHDVPLDNEECPFKKSPSKMKSTGKFSNQTYIGLNKPFDSDDPDFEPVDDEIIDDLRSHGVMSVEEYLDWLNAENIDAERIGEQIEQEEYVFDNLINSVASNGDSIKTDVKYYNSLNKLEALRRIYRQKLESDENYWKQQEFERFKEEWYEEYYENNDD